MCIVNLNIWYVEPMHRRVFVCPNPKCNEKIEELFLVNDYSTTPAKHYYACPHCLLKLNVHASVHRNLMHVLAGLFSTAFGSIILVWIGWLTWYDVTVYGKDITLIFFGSRTGQTISLGIDMKLIYYTLIGLALFIFGLSILLRNRSKIIERRFSATAPEREGAHGLDEVKKMPRVTELELWKKREEERLAEKMNVASQKWFKHNPFIAKMVYDQTTWNKPNSKFHAWLLDCKVNYFPCFLYLKPGEAGITQKQAIEEICVYYPYEVVQVKEENICCRLKKNSAYDDLYVKYAGELWRAYLNLRRLKGIKGYTRNIFLGLRWALWEEYNRKKGELEEIYGETPESEIPRDWTKKLKVENVGLW